MSWGLRLGWDTPPHEQLASLKKRFGWRWRASRASGNPDGTYPDGGMPGEPEGGVSGMQGSPLNAAPHQSSVPGLSECPGHVRPPCPGDSSSRLILASTPASVAALGMSPWR